jgi:hypothetical protein
LKFNKTTHFLILHQYSPPRTSRTIDFVATGTLSNSQRKEYSDFLNELYDPQYNTPSRAAHVGENQGNKPGNEPGNEPGTKPDGAQLANDNGPGAPNRYYFKQTAGFRGGPTTPRDWLEQYNRDDVALRTKQLHLYGQHVEGESEIIFQMFYH